MAVRRNRGKKRKLGTGSKNRAWPTDDELNTLFEQLKDEGAGPISTAILGASFLEFQLETMLRPKFPYGGDKNWWALTSDRGPINTFQQKIMLAYSLNLITEHLSEVLHVIRRVRNIFAHSKRVVGFDNAEVIAELAALPLPKKKSTSYKLLNGARSRSESEPRKAFLLIFYFVHSEILRRKLKTAKSSYRYSKKKLEKLEINAPVISQLFRDVGDSPSAADLERGFLSLSSVERVKAIEELRAMPNLRLRAKQAS